LNKIKIGIVQLNPHTLWRKGGGEIHARKYIEFGNSENYEISIFDFNSPKAYDIIHIFGSAYNLNEIGKYAKLENIKVVHTPILYPTENVFKYKMFLKFGTFLPFPTTLNLRQELLMSADVLIANSKPEASYIQEAYSINENKIKVLGTGVDSSFLEYEFSENDLPQEIRHCEKYILMVGRVTPLKNQLNVLKLLKDNYNIVLVGQVDKSFPEYESEIRILIEENKNIYWYENINQQDNSLKAIYANAFCHVLWSITEVAALVNMEAAALGTLLISRNLQTTKDIMKGHSLYASNETELLHNIKQLELLTLVQKSERIAETKKYIKEKYTWEKIVQNSIEIYNQLLNK
jgi:glycosyltransferase involved in cell wall biosynthesis